MQNSVAAIRAGRSRARYVLPQAHHRERRLGLHRLFRTPAARSEVTQARLHPFDALRQASRGPSSVEATGPSRAPIAALRREPRMSWAPKDRLRTRSSAPWRG
ncbi:MAG: hypothetical protein H0T04_01675 [Chloroflexi bacterium]|nr:hypothetical protein [Chloroflexota bacterium]MBA3851513.1 hypothetical protein [Chloroflexota bacterium]MDQ3408302.1 hypothetical protein [Chloroflexota bacterium]